MGREPPRSEKPLSEDIAAMAFLQSAALCQGVPEESLKALYTRGAIVAFGAGQVIFAPGDSDDALYLVVDGSVTITKTVEGRPVAVATLERQAVFGESAVLTQRPRSSTAQARVECRLVRLPGEVVRAVAEAAPKLGRKLAGLMAGRAKDNEKKLAAP
jgi:CRP-like cAMP-binding protein